MFYVYILKSLKDESFYIGYTADLDDRLRRHNKGDSRYTRNHRPFELIHTESYDSRSEAIRREKQIKSYKGGAAFRKLVT